jgi:hypothetical protein
VVAVSANQTSITVDCGAGNHAVGGGGRTTSTTGSGGNQSSNFQGSFPSGLLGLPVGSGTNPRFWTATFFQIDPSNAAYALCVPNTP